ncbi:hypothetical protein LF65_02892 [Clostridium beijerinckii]|uniref:Uncharacterized protein n=1 Tax=Clostridium beijerinckii TaxID=1520 RepID=A0A0B5QN57_CLOBE|nr:SDR family NAD(P)-dependent oxidoreductase [Clostridium beijerinckii]AJG99462.1 hypothetical protein LF65_02892 [Clostridium beijerinckii]
MKDATIDTLKDTIRDLPEEEQETILFEFNDNENVKKIEYDVSCLNGIENLVDKIGHVDILVNNAGIMNSIPYDTYSNGAFPR